MKKYLLCPGLVFSKTDGDAHHISARQLAALYGVNMSECEIEPKDRRQGYQERAGLIKLRPRYHGDYTLPGTEP